MYYLHIKINYGIINIIILLCGDLMERRMIEGIEILHYDCVDSTNKTAMLHGERKHLLTFVSDTQTQGRGRMGRSFFSYNGGLYMSVILDPLSINIPYHLCTPAAALAVKQAVEAYGVKNTQIKWVNDILLDNKKICGILTEGKTENNRVERIVVGIGINLSDVGVSFPEDIKNKAGYAFCNADNVTLAAEIVRNLGKLCKGKREDIVSQYSKELAYVGESVTVTDYSNNNSKIKGKILGVNEDCYLKLELPDKTVKLLSSGEII